ncbi:hypothetical protein Vi05172_g9372 [Venturia inaequalis]|nr:hypothetical protein Vi05172_g9372 [Venturia inaequalis]
MGQPMTDTTVLYNFTRTIDAHENSGTKEEQNGMRETSWNCLPLPNIPCCRQNLMLSTALCCLVSSGYPRAVWPFINLPASIAAS